MQCPTMSVESDNQLDKNLISVTTISNDQVDSFNHSCMTQSIFDTGIGSCIKSKGMKISNNCMVNLGTL
jgi:hypothetical protein